MMYDVSIDKLLEGVIQTDTGPRIIGYRSKYMGRWHISCELYSKTVEEIREYLKGVKESAELHDIYFEIFELYLSNGLFADVASELNGEVE